MTTQKIQEVVDRYCDYFVSKNIPAEDFSHEKLPITNTEALAHCHGMFAKMEQFLQ